MDYDIQENIFYIFIDGASRSVFNKKLKRKTGRYGGKGIWFVYYNKKIKLIELDKSNFRSYISATNNDMEVGACADGLEAALNEDDLSIFKKILVVTDSMFVYTYRKSAVYMRSQNGRKKKDTNPVVHSRTWKKLIKYMNEIYQKHKIGIDYDWVGSHQKDDGSDDRVTYNNQADRSAVQGAQSKSRIPSDGSSGVRALFFKKNALDKKKGFISSLPINGKKVYIHICAYRKLKKGFRYNYELVSRDHEYFTYRSYIWYTQKTLSAEVIYLVTINSNNQIEEIISEYTKEEIKQKMIADGIDTSILYGKLGKE